MLQNYEFLTLQILMCDACNLYQFSFFLIFLQIFDDQSDKFLTLKKFTCFKSNVNTEIHPSIELRLEPELLDFQELGSFLIRFYNNFFCTKLCL